MLPVNKNYVKKTKKLQFLNIYLKSHVWPDITSDNYCII